VYVYIYIYIYIIYNIHAFPFIAGVRVIIDKKAQLTLLGTEMDFVETTLSSEFVFNNPNIKGTCGCGESFSV
jgi:iron-sulfur cluster assembly accessory protein